MFQWLKKLRSSKANSQKPLPIPLIGFSPYPNNKPADTFTPPTLESLQYSDMWGLMGPNGYIPFNSKEGQEAAMKFYEDLCRKEKKKFNNALDRRQPWYYQKNETFAKTILSGQPIGSFVAREQGKGKSRDYARIYFVGQNRKIMKVRIQIWTDSVFDYYKLKEADFHFDSVTQVLDFLVTSQLPLQKTILTTPVPKRT